MIKGLECEIDTGHVGTVIGVDELVESTLVNAAGIDVRAVAAIRRDSEEIVQFNICPGRLEDAEEVLGKIVTQLYRAEPQVSATFQKACALRAGVAVGVIPYETWSRGIVVLLCPVVQDCSQVIATVCHVLKFLTRGVVDFVAHDTLEGEAQVEALIANVPVESIGEVGEGASAIDTVVIVDGAIAIDVLETYVARLGTGLNELPVLVVCLYFLFAVEIAVSGNQPESCNGIAGQGLCRPSPAMNGSSCDELAVSTHADDLVLIEGTIEASTIVPVFSYVVVPADISLGYEDADRNPIPLAKVRYIEYSGNGQSYFI